MIRSDYYGSIEMGERGKGGKGDGGIFDQVLMKLLFAR